MDARNRARRLVRTATGREDCPQCTEKPTVLDSNLGKSPWPTNPPTTSTANVCRYMATDKRPQVPLGTMRCPLSKTPTAAAVYLQYGVLDRGGGADKHYGTVIALDGVDFRIGEGVTGLMGPNGAGKSTAIKLFLGLIKPTSGSAQVLGGRLYESIRIRSRLGYMPETAVVKTLAQMCVPAATEFQILTVSDSARCLTLRSVSFLIGSAPDISARRLL